MRRQPQLSGGDVPPGAESAVLPHPDVHPLHAHRHRVLALLLAHRGRRRRPHLPRRAHRAHHDHAELLRQRLAAQVRGRVRSLVLPAYRLRLGLMATPLGPGRTASVRSFVQPVYRLRLGLTTMPLCTCRTTSLRSFVLPVYRSWIVLLSTPFCAVGQSV